MVPGTTTPPHSNPSIASLAPRGFSPDTRVNLIIGILTIVIGALSTLLAWSTWRLTDGRRRGRLGHQRPTPPERLIELQPMPTPAGPGYEVALRFRESS